MFLSFEKKLTKQVLSLYADSLSSKISDLPVKVEVKEKGNSWLVIIAKDDISFNSLDVVYEVIVSGIESSYRDKPIKVVVLEQKSNKRPYKKLIAIASGKGGVGKSTICANLAFAAQKLGYKVGVVDADIYGPSIHHLFAIDEHKPEVKDGKIIPAESHGIKVMSMGFMVASDNALIWRGAMITKSLHNLISGTDWGELDFLFVDMPPGTGDIYLSLAKTFQVDATILVATPQRLALLDVKRSLDFMHKLNVPILGLVSNMSYLTEGKKRNYIFGQSLVDFAKDNNLKLLGEVGLIPEISKLTDEQQMIDGDNVKEVHDLLCEIVKEINLD